MNIDKLLFFLTSIVIILVLGASNYFNEKIFFPFIDLLGIFYSLIAPVILSVILIISLIIIVKKFLF